MSLPKLGDLPGDVDWKALDLTLVDRVMSLPNRLMLADDAISFWWDVVADEDCMQTETDHKAGTCGLESWLIAVDLCKRYGIPKSNLPFIAWDFLAPLKQ